MASLIKGIPVILYDRVQTGVDAFNAPIYEESAIEVKNVLVCPADTADIVNDIQLYGKQAVYELFIPKGDEHIWEDRIVEFFGKKWRTFGFPQLWIEENIPLDWNQKVKVARHG